MIKPSLSLTFALALAVTLLAACGSPSTKPGATAAPTQSSFAALDSRDAKLLAHNGYVVDSHLDVAVAAGTVLHVFHSVCAGSVDGSCQEVTVFRDHAEKVIWRKHYNGPSKLIASTAGFTVKYEEYRATDPICCPSGPSIFDTYHWTGSGFSRTTRAEPHS